MIISRAPLRVSFLGGGTDYAEFYRNFGVLGKVIGCSIQKYVYVSLLPQPVFEETKFRFTYRLTEQVDRVEAIKHPVVREALKDMNWSRPINLATMADLPGRSGLGSSSSFTVALLNALNSFEGSKLQHSDLAMRAVHIERELIGEPGGMQDQYHASHGNLRAYHFQGKQVSVSDPLGSIEFRSLLSESLFLIALGGVRDSAFHANKLREKISNLEISNPLLEMVEISTIFEDQIAAKNAEEGLELLGELTKNAWNIKKRISEIGPDVDTLISDGISHGALAGKLCGAGGTGFAAFLVPRDAQAHFYDHFESSHIIKCPLDVRGAEVHQIG